MKRKFVCDERKQKKLVGHTQKSARSKVTWILVYFSDAALVLWMGMYIKSLSALGSGERSSSPAESIHEYLIRL